MTRRKAGTDTWESKLENWWQRKLWLGRKKEKINFEAVGANRLSELVCDKTVTRNADTSLCILPP